MVATSQIPKALKRYPITGVSSDGSVVRNLGGPRGVLLDPTRQNSQVVEFYEKLNETVIGQPKVVKELSSCLQLYLSGFNNPTRPIKVLLFLGPTGSGKTYAVESAAEILFGDRTAVVKIDCAEFQHNHEIAKLVGSPPGYLGHRETRPKLTQENLDRCHEGDFKFTFVMFDEIEKAGPSLSNLLLGVMDKGSLTLGDNRKVDFSRTVIVLTSNLGARQISEFLSGGIGFSSRESLSRRAADSRKISKTARQAVVRNYSPEFVNRLDSMVVFKSLTKDQIYQILERELIKIQNRITSIEKGTKFVFHCSPEVKQYFLDEGWDPQYGGRHLNRTLERRLVEPLANLVVTEQVENGDVVNLNWDSEAGRVVFTKDPRLLIIDVPPQELERVADDVNETSDELIELPPENFGFPISPGLHMAEQMSKLKLDM